MRNNVSKLLAVATVTAGMAAGAQTGAFTGQSESAAPIVRVAPARVTNAIYTAGAERLPARNSDGRRGAPLTSSPLPGVVVSVSTEAALEKVSATPDNMELRLSKGVANVRVDHPEGNGRLLVDLPGGQVALLKDGLYTFNADTNTTRVFRGEAEGFAGTAGKGIKIKEDQRFAFGTSPLRASSMNASAASADLLPGGFGGSERSGFRGEGYLAGGYGAPFGYGGYPYGAGFGGYGFDYPYGYGFGYPYGVGLGIGFGYGGFYGGGFRGGFGGFRGGGFRR